MPGASSTTLRVTNVNANWAADGHGGDGSFELLLVTEDGARHTVAPSLAAVPALLAMITASPVLLWDADNQTAIGANIVGEWLPEDYSRLDRGDAAAGTPAVPAVAEDRPPSPS